MLKGTKHPSPRPIPPSHKHFLYNAFLNDVASVCWESVVTQTDDVDILVKNWSALF